MKTSGHRDKFRRSLKPIPNRYIVVLDDQIVGESLLRVPAANRKQIAEHDLRCLADGVFTNTSERICSGNDPEPVQLPEQGSIGFRYVEEDGIVTAAATETIAPEYSTRMSPASTAAEARPHDYSPDGSGVHVYIIDSGIRVTHSDFGGRASVAYDIVGDGQNRQRLLRHGTHVAGHSPRSATYGVAKGFPFSAHAVWCSDLCSRTGIGLYQYFMMGDRLVNCRITPARPLRISAWTRAACRPRWKKRFNNSIRFRITYLDRRPEQQHGCMHDLARPHAERPNRRCLQRSSIRGQGFSNLELSGSFRPWHVG